ncbi:thioredoxin domain-containing protein [Candidatus Woesearchaeota archaeon]|nr:thioredoxin domain-containing protein [Candidatus Woesearchaeota archaeon]
MDTKDIIPGALLAGVLLAMILLTFFLPVLFPAPAIKLEGNDVTVPDSFFQDQRMTSTAAKVAIIVFSNFQCTHCAAAEPLIRALSERQDIRLLVKHAPTDDITFFAAMAAECARQQHNYWKMSDALFEQSSLLSEASVVAKAKQIGLDQTLFSACMQDPAIQQLVDQDQQDAATVGVRGTPTVLIGTGQGMKLYEGMPTQEQIDAMVTIMEANA